MILRLLSPGKAYHAVISGCWLSDDFGIRIVSVRVKDAVKLDAAWRADGIRVVSISAADDAGGAASPHDAAAELVAINACGGWDAGNDHFQPTSWQVSNIHAGTGASNVIPGTCVVDFNFRFCTESTPKSLQERLTAVLDRHGLEYNLEWVIGGLPFLTASGALVQAVNEVIREETGVESELSTTGGTSDGRFIAQVCPEVIELGPPNASIHKIDEHVEVAELETLKNIYRRLLTQLTV